MLALLIFALSASAAERTVCLNIGVVDDRTRCADGADAGARRPCDPGSTVPAVGAVFQLWDKDGSSEGDDDYIGTWFKANEGRGCATFEWEYSMANVFEQEANPDVFVRIPYRVKATTTSHEIRQVNHDDGEPRVSTDFRDDAVMNCTVGVDCEIAPGQYLVVSTNVADMRAKQMMALDSAQHALHVLGPAFTDDIDMVVPDPTVLISVSTGSTEFSLADDSITRGDTPSHEVAHCLHQQQIDREGLASDCSFGGDSHSMTGTEYESCATSEGFADFVAAVAMWDDDNDLSRPRVFGQVIEKAAPLFSPCSDNVGVELLVARGFWDLVDSNNEAAVAPANAADGANMGEVNLVEGWANFDNGTGNRKDWESDVDGPNLRDFFYNNNTNPAFPAYNFFTTLLNHNCLGHQDNG